MQLTTNFTKEEFSHSIVATNRSIDNTIPEQLMPNVLITVKWLQLLRDRLCKYYGKTIHISINSGYRSLKLNKVVGGSKSSAHINGLAADIVATSITPCELMEFIFSNMQDTEFDQCILEYNRWIHIGFSTNGTMRKQCLCASKVTSFYGTNKTVYSVYTQ